MLVKKLRGGKESFKEEATDSNPTSLPSTISSSQLPSSSFNSDIPRRESLGKLSSSSLEQLGILGRGASGQVSKCLHAPSMTVLALKSINVGEQQRRHQFMSELFQLDTMNNCDKIVEFYGAYYEESHVFIAMEFMNRGALDVIIRKLAAGWNTGDEVISAASNQKRKIEQVKETLDERVISSCIKQILIGLKYLHDRNKIHRDVRENKAYYQGSKTDHVILV